MNENIGSLVQDFSGLLFLPGKFQQAKEAKKDGEREAVKKIKNPVCYCNQ